MGSGLVDSYKTPRYQSTRIQKTQTRLICKQKAQRCQGADRKAGAGLGARSHHPSGEWQVLRHRGSGKLGSSMLGHPFIPAPPQSPLPLRLLWNEGVEGIARTQCGVQADNTGLLGLCVARPPGLWHDQLIMDMCLSHKTSASLTICGEG